MIVFVLYVFSLLIVQGIADFLLTVGVAAGRYEKLKIHTRHRRFTTGKFMDSMVLWPQSLWR